MYEMREILPATHLISKGTGMRVPGLLIATKKMIHSGEIDKPLEQLCNIAHLRGVTGYSIAMPDIHWGYGFPIGGVAAMDCDEGVISPGGVGYDINCGVRLALVPLPFDAIGAVQREELLKTLYALIPSGVGAGNKAKALSDSDYRHLIEQGAEWSISQGYGFSRDLEGMESRGYIEGGELAAVSALARERGRNQLGSIGSGNHFVEIGSIEKLYLQEVASAWSVSPGYTYIFIHTGSRGFGHQICQDTLDQFIGEGLAEGLPDRQLVAAPIKSPQGRQYIAAMAAAANYAFNNRQQILHGVRLAFEKVCGIPQEQIRLLYDVCHNIAKFETHLVDGAPKRLCVHRKGATRAFGPGHVELSPLFRTTGQPVLVPGDMGRASHLMVGLGNPLTWCSACHGAGRAQSRIQSMKRWSGRDLIGEMRGLGVAVMATSTRTIAEEMPDAYKDVDEVVEAVEEAQLAVRVARLRPRMVLKG